MKNKEKYFDELLSSLVGPGGQCSFRLKNVLKEKGCYNYTCKSCDKKTKEWFEQEYKVLITEDEKAILKCLEERWKWIARDENGILLVYQSKPKKYGSKWSADDGYFYIMRFRNCLFQFIKWEDKEPYLIEDLLNES